LIPSTVRPQRFDLEPISLQQPIFAFNALDPAPQVIKARDGTEYGKMSVSVRCYAFAAGESSREQIECAARRIDDDPSLDIET
jgi:hypothetical protein